MCLRNKEIFSRYDCLTSAMSSDPDLPGEDVFCSMDFLLPRKMNQFCPFPWYGEVAAIEDKYLIK